MYVSYGPFIQLMLPYGEKLVGTIVKDDKKDELSGEFIAE